MEALLFWTFALVVTAGAVGVVVAKNPVHGAMSLVGSFFALAGLFLLLEAQLVAALQIVVYAGAIMVLFLFVIMLLNLGPRDLGAPQIGPGKGFGLLAAIATVVLLLRVLWPLSPTQTATSADFGTVAGVGRVLYTAYTLPFEVVSLLLLTAIVAAVVVAKGKIEMIGLHHYLALATILFGIGLAGVLVRRNALTIFMSIELMMNAANLVFLAFARFPLQGNPTSDGHAIAFFVMAVAAAEAAVGLAIVIAVFRVRGSVNVDELRALKN